ncbi:MAG: ABC transporter permease [Gammaproteobacteria bacterium]
MVNMQYTFLRLWAILKKEFILISRDKRTYLFLLIIPFSEVILFGYTINTDAKHLPSIVVTHDTSQITNSIIANFRNTGYFDIKTITDNEETAKKLLEANKVQFIINIPSNFTRDFIRNDKPHILLQGDASDPVAVSGAFRTAQNLPLQSLEKETSGSLHYLAPTDGSNYVIDTHALYNPGIVAQYHTLPGLIMAILTISLVMLTAISITTEYEQGSMEVLLVTPAKPLDIIIGKIIPNIILGYILLMLTVIVSHFLFKVPFEGSLFLFLLASFPFIVANLGIGIAASSVSKSQFQAANIANTYNLPAILFSGFMFPFYGMPKWAQDIGNLLPTTHFTQLTTNIMLKGATFTQIWGNLWPILLFMFLIILISYKNYRNTLD